MPRKTRQVETRMVAEYLAKNYSSFTYMQAVPLGAVPNKLLEEKGYAKALGVMRPFRPEVDAIVVMPKYLLLIEAKVWQPVPGLAKLPLYKSLVEITPELKQYMPREIIMELVVGQTYPNLETMATSAGVRIKVFSPPWLAEVIASMNKYWTPEYREHRAKKLAMREYYGVD